MTCAEPQCSRCRFWTPVPGEDGHALGQCRRFPPSYEGWAMTHGYDWCGEFTASLEPTPC